MKKILVFIIAIAMGVGVVNAAVRDGNSASRGGTSTQKRVSTTIKSDRSITPRTTVLNAANSSRAVTPNNSRATVARTANKNVTARVAKDDTISVSETRTGAEYETCKSAFFTCMDQFCALKNDDYRRCSCSNRVDSLAQSREALIQTGEQITVFTESLDTVGMTAAQATALHTATEGENALTSDTSTSKALLQAIMNSIRGGDTTVGGKYSNLNSINMAFDTSIAFGTSDNGQVIAAYNGQNLYSAVYPQCRNAVRQDCNDASLQRAITAYLMAIEQDCNTVQTAIEQKQKELKYAVRESSAMLDLARVENRQKHNTDDFTTCINNVESAILSEEVCGANYHKCLDNGKYIDISTGAPITGVEKFYELGTLLSFDDENTTANQRLSKITRNKQFIVGFEKRTKKFAEPALDKCTEIADTVWSEYLDKAMLTIYYAQQAKVAEVKQGCFDFVSQCYESTDKSITTAMSKLLGESAVLLQPSKVKLGASMCQEYVNSCNNMFSGGDETSEQNFIAEYVDTRKDADLLSACRAVVKQCFDKYGGSGYENFYYPYSGIFNKGFAPNWFTLYNYSADVYDEATFTKEAVYYGSPCVLQLTTIDACSEPDIVEEAFGGFDAYIISTLDSSSNDCTQTRTCPLATDTDLNNNNFATWYGVKDSTNLVHNRELRPVGVATEIYNQIIDTLSTQCRNLNGRFKEIPFLQDETYQSESLCKWNQYKETAPTGNDATDKDKSYWNLQKAYGIKNSENMCPRDYALSVDISSWGICSCWENGGRRSKNGRSATCIPQLPAIKHFNNTDTPDEPAEDADCEKRQCGDNGWAITLIQDTGATNNNDTAYWCTRNAIDKKNRVCPDGYPYIDKTSKDCSTSETGGTKPDQFFYSLVPEGS